MYSWAASQVGSAIDCTPTVTTLFFSWARLTTAMASAMVRVMGFSMYTSLPASMASMAMRACQWSGVAMQTTSTSLTLSRMMR